MAAPGTLGIDSLMFRYVNSCAWTWKLFLFTLMLELEQLASATVTLALVLFKAAPARVRRAAYVLFSNRSSRRRASEPAPATAVEHKTLPRAGNTGPAGASEPGGDAEAPLDAGSQRRAARRRAGSAKPSSSA